MKFVILTYLQNLSFAETTQSILKEQWDIDAEIVIGYTIGETYTKYNVIAHGMKDYIIDVYNDDIFYLEDDVRFTHNPMSIDFTKDIVWCVYRRGKITNKNHIITGSQAIYFSKKSINRFKTYMTKNKFKQIDSYISDFIYRNPDLTFQQPKKIGYECEHNSLISKKEHWMKYTKPN